MNASSRVKDYVIHKVDLNDYHCYKTARNFVKLCNNVIVVLLIILGTVL